jgi:hypothetical protein
VTSSPSAWASSISARTIEVSVGSADGLRSPSMNDPSIFRPCTGSLRSQARLE